MSGRIIFILDVPFFSNFKSTYFTYNVAYSYTCHIPNDEGKDTRGKSVKMSHVSYLGNGRSDQDFLHMLKTIGDLQLFELWYLSLVLKLAM